MSNSGDSALRLTLDEASQRVTLFVVDTGYTLVTNGVFSPDKVSFVVPGRYEFQYTINRIDLSFQRTIVQITQNGVCSIEQVPQNRKF